MKNQIIGPIYGSVRSLTALIVAGVVAAMAYQGKLTAEQFLPLATLVFTFYFLKDALRAPSVAAPTIEPALPIVGTETVN